MTPTEAISWLRFLESKRAFRSYLSPIRKQRETNLSIMQALETAIDALRKQVPKKLEWGLWSPSKGVACCICPACGLRFVRSGVENYCQRCGQKLDLEDAQ